MSKIIALLLLLIIPFVSRSQFGGITSKIKTKINQRVDNKTDKIIDQSLDEAEGKNSGNDAVISKEEKPAEIASPNSETTAFSSRYDFIPGTEILYYNNFDQESIAELPLSWNTNGSGEVVSSDKYPGKWLQVHTPFIYLTGNSKTLSENFTFEFDVILQLKNNGWMYPTFTSGLFSSSNESNTDNKFLKEYNQYASLSATIYPGENGSSKVMLESYSTGKKYFSSEPKTYGELDKYYHKPVHVAVQVQKQRFRMWINATKIFDIPKGIDTTFKMNQVFFKVGQTNYKEEQYGIFISNIKIATGVSDTRHKLIGEGKFSTTGILFEVNSATVKPESYGIIKEIAAILKDNPSVKIKIVGHTSNDGDDQANLELSKKRAESIKNILVKEFTIDQSGIETTGMGETKPIKDNQTKEGKAANRRVEFIKLPGS